MSFPIKCIEAGQNFLNNSSSSPLKGSEYKLSYYDPNVNFKVIAVVSQNEEPDTIKLATSTGNVERFLDFAYLDFKLGRSKYSLPVYKYLDGINQGDLFFCFLDQTNSTSTYPGGRYIDIEFENAKRISIKSFNHHTRSKWGEIYWKLHCFGRSIGYVITYLHIGLIWISGTIWYYM